MRRSVWFLFAALWVPTPAHAESPSAKAPPAAEPADSTESADADDADDADDVLAVLELPVAAADARAAGVPDEDVKLAVRASAEAGWSAADAELVLSAEVDARTKHGPRSGFGAWLRAEVAKGRTPKELRDEARAERQAYREVSAEERDAAQEKLEALRKERKTQRAELRAKWKAARAAGKPVKLRGKARRHKRHKRFADKGLRLKLRAAAGFNAPVRMGLRVKPGRGNMGRPPRSGGPGGAAAGGGTPPHAQHGEGHPGLAKGHDKHDGGRGKSDPKGNADGHDKTRGPGDKPGKVVTRPTRDVKPDIAPRGPGQGNGPKAMPDKPDKKANGPAKVKAKHHPEGKPRNDKAKGKAKGAK